MSLLPSCRDLSRLLCEARDTGRPLGAHARLHLWVCEACRRLKAQLGLIGDAVKREPGGGPGLSSEAKARLKRSLE